MKSIEAGTADKLFTRRLRNGFCALHHPSSNESVVFRFDPALVPYVGVWICYGGWPVDGTYTSYAVALEPCNGWPDSLARAAEQGDCAFLASGETKRWSLRVELRAGPPPVPSQSQRG